MPIDHQPSVGSTFRWLWFLRFLCLVALGLSGFLLYSSLTGERLPGCGTESGCGAVLSSRWAYLFGIPVSLPALILYSALLAASFVYERTTRATLKLRVRDFMLFSAVALLSAAVWFIGLQVFVIGAFCRFCMTAHGCGAIIAILLLTQLGKSSSGLTPKEPTPPTPRRASSLAVFAGFFAVLLLALGQAFVKPNTFAVTSSPGLAARKTPRILRLHGGVFQLDLSEVPLVGSAEAPALILELFDYSCSHCRALHPILVETSKILSNRLALISLPMPLATNCNWYMTRAMPAHINACTYARFGLAVWRANRAKSPEFDDWIFAPDRPPSPAEVEAEAMRLVGTNNFNQALADPWINQQIEMDVRLYGTNYLASHKSVLPELMIGTNIISGGVSSTPELLRLLTAQFDLGLPTASTNSP